MQIAFKEERQRKTEKKCGLSEVEQLKQLSRIEESAAGGSCVGFGERAKGHIFPSYVNILALLLCYFLSSAVGGQVLLDTTTGEEGGSNTHIVHLRRILSRLLKPFRGLARRQNEPDCFSPIGSAPLD